MYHDPELKDIKTSLETIFNTLECLWNYPGDITGDDVVNLAAAIDLVTSEIADATEKAEV